MATCSAAFFFVFFFSFRSGTVTCRFDCFVVATVNVGTTGGW
jgi:hypothetical protein